VAGFGNHGRHFLEKLSVLLLVRVLSRGDSIETADILQLIFKFVSIILMLKLLRFLEGLLVNVLESLRDLNALEGRIILQVKIFSFASLFERLSD